MAEWSASDIATASSMRAAGKPWDEIGRAVGRTGHSVRQKFWNLPNGESAIPDPGERLQYKDSGESAELSGGIRKRIVTLEDALEAGKVDLKTWRVKDYTINKWEMGYVNPEKQANVIPLWQVKVRLERIHKRCYSDSLELLFGKLKTLPKRREKLPLLAKGDRLFVPCLFDAHLGKYAWGEETGTDQDTNIQANVYRNAMSDLIELSGGGFDRVLFQLGNDFFQVNNWLNTTAKGTPVDHDGRFPKVFYMGFMEVVGAIDKCLEIGLYVDVTWIPGNHDPQTSHALAVAIWAYYHDNPRVKVDFGPSPRKYYRYGVNLLGMTHGNEERKQDLPTLMAQERSQDWADTTTRDWFTGHEHRKQVWMTKDTQERLGIRIWTIPGLTGTDSWHHAKGFVGAHRAAEAYVYGREAGYMGHWSVAARS
jgi:hypothetical protein